MHHEDRDAHQRMVDTHYRDMKPKFMEEDMRGYFGEYEGMTFHPPTINELLEQRRQQERANYRADIITVAVCVVCLVAVVAIVLMV